MDSIEVFLSRLTDAQKITVLQSARLYKRYHSVPKMIGWSKDAQKAFLALTKDSPFTKIKDNSDY